MPYLNYCVPNWYRLSCHNCQILKKIYETPAFCLQSPTPSNLKAPLGAGFSTMRPCVTFKNPFSYFYYRPPFSHIRVVTSSLAHAIRSTVATSVERSIFRSCDVGKSVY
ncbi:hypothetical protein NQ317_006565 [Molorchus minor]|uniref:Uncharacterized protein n=1 Tax=Molorchus minor TaxID=1323400 RepID=A0ABQ9K3B9_9CUCU|nr:hypothetical protein NQ317_006565 [Molorchus minor]